jgi:hypothetical protein
MGFLVTVAGFGSAMAGCYWELWVEFKFEWLVLSVI